MKISINVSTVASAATLLLGAGSFLLSPLSTPSAHAQTAPAAGGSGADAAAKALPPISLDLRDAPIRQALEQLFSSAGVQFSIDNNVSGFVTLKIVDQPFDSALKVLLRSASQSLSYTHEGGVYFIKPRAIAADNTPSAPEPPDTTTDDSDKNKVHLEEIQLTYADPADLQGILGVSILTNFQRAGSSNSNGNSSGRSGSTGLGSGGYGGNTSGLGSTGLSGLGTGSYGGSSSLGSTGLSGLGSSGLSGLGGYGGSTGSRY